VTQACRLLTAPLAVTRCRGHWVAELAGRPALDVYREAAREPLAGDLRRAARFVLAALPRPGAPGAYVVRSVSGFDPARGAFALPDRLAPGDAIALALREPEGARRDLKRMLAELSQPRPALGLYLGCCGRAAALFGVPGLEAGYLVSALEPAPALGVLGALQIGPLAGRPEVLTQAGVLAALDP
jgi:small ligand-binding sensory domain FIST